MVILYKGLDNQDKNELVVIEKQRFHKFDALTN